MVGGTASFNCKRDILQRLASAASRFTPSCLCKANTDRGIPTPASSSIVSAQPAAIEPLDQSQEYSLPGIPGQQPIDQPAATPDDLAGHVDHRRAERPEL